MRQLQLNIRPRSFSGKRLIRENDHPGNDFPGNVFPGKKPSGESNHPGNDRIPMDTINLYKSVEQSLPVGAEASMNLT